MINVHVKKFNLTKVSKNSKLCQMKFHVWPNQLEKALVLKHQGLAEIKESVCSMALYVEGKIGVTFLETSQKL